MLHSASIHSHHKDSYIMHFKLATLLPLFAFGYTTTASPIAAPVTGLVKVPGVVLSNITPTPAVASLGPHAAGIPAPTIPGLSTTSENSAFHALDARAPDTWYLLLCLSTNCGNCYSYSMIGRILGTCYTGVSGFVSVGVQSPMTGAPAPWKIYVGSNCNGYLIPEVNVCYGLSPPGNTFFLQ